jgi:hypothetical protein
MMLQEGLLSSASASTSILDIFATVAARYTDIQSHVSLFCTNFTFTGVLQMQYCRLKPRSNDASVVIAAATCKPNFNNTSIVCNFSYHASYCSRKKKVSCVQARCPHIYCGRCAEKMVKEYGPNIFKEGCPVCLELCCCSNKSYSCSRVNHCYRKCPASKVKSSAGHEEKNLKYQSNYINHTQPSLSMEAVNYLEDGDDGCGDQETAAVALCSLIRADHSVSPKSRLAQVESSGESVSASDEEAKVPNRPFKKRTINQAEHDHAIPILKKAREITQQLSRSKAYNPARKTAALPSLMSSTVQDYPYPFLSNPHNMMLQQYPLFYQISNGNAYLVNGGGNGSNGQGEEGHQQQHPRRLPGMEVYGNDLGIAYPYAYPLHISGSDLAQLPSHAQVLMSHHHHSAYAAAAGYPPAYSVDKNYMLFSSNSLGERK